MSYSSLEHMVCHNASDALFIAEVDGRIVHVNERTVALTGFSVEELESMSFDDLVPRGVQERYVQHRDSFTGTGGNRPVATLTGQMLQMKGGKSRTVTVELSGGAVAGHEYMVAAVRPDGPVRDVKGTMDHVTALSTDIDDRTPTDQEAPEGASPSRDVQPITLHGTWVWNLVTGDLAWSPETYSIFGRTRDSFGNTYETFLECVHPDDRAMVEDAVRDALEQRTFYSIDHRIVHPSGEVRWVHEQGEEQRDAQGRATHMSGVTYDVTERILAELRAQDLADIVENSLTEILVFDRDSLHFTYINGSASRNLGYSRTELDRLTLSDISPRYEAEGFQRLVAPLLAGEVSDLEFSSVLHRKDGTSYPVDVRLQLGRFEGQRAFVALMSDVTERREAQASLEVSKERLLDAQRIGRFGYWEWMIQTGDLYWSDEIYRIFGQEPQSFAATYAAFFDMIHPEDRDAVTEAVNAAVSGESEYSLVHRVVQPDGDTRWVREQGEVSRSEDGQPVRMLGTVQDITEAEVFQKTIAEREARFRSLMDASPLGITFYDREARIREANPASLSIMGHATLPDGHGPDSYLFPNPEISPEQEASLRAGQVVRLDIDLPGIDDTPGPGGVDSLEVRSVSIVIVPVGADEETDPAGYFLLTEDVSARKRAENSLRSSLEEKEVLLREVHHRVKNNLQVISSLLHLQSRQVQDPEYVDMFDASRARVLSMAMMYEELHRREDFASVDMATYSARIARGLLAAYQKPGVTLDTDFDDIGLGIDQAVPFGLLLNELLTNAFKHAYPGEEGGLVFLGLTQPEPGCACLVVRDSGVGFDEDGAGSTFASLGIQLARSLVDQLEGEFSVAVDRGTTFRVDFPIRTRGEPS